MVYYICYNSVFEDSRQIFMRIQIAPSSLPKGRARPSQVLSGAGEVVSVDDVSGILGVERQAASKLLARWSGQGWVRRLRRGFYAPVPIASLGQEQVLEDPWVLVPELFGPACNLNELLVALENAPDIKLFGHERRSAAARSDMTVMDEVARVQDIES